MSTATFELRTHCKKSIRIKKKYLVTDNLTTFSEEREEFKSFFPINNKADDILKLKGKGLSSEQLDKIFQRSTDEAFDYINQKYVTASKSKAKFLDVNGECLTRNGDGENARPNIGWLDGSINYTEDEIERLKAEALKVKGKKFTDEFLLKQGVVTEKDYINWYVKDRMEYMAKQFIANLHDTAKPKGKPKTKIKDVEMFYNPHLEYDDQGLIKGGHTHIITHMFSPTTGLYLNFPHFGKLMQTAHGKLEEQNKNILDQGVHIGQIAMDAEKQKQQLFDYYNERFATDIAQELSKQHLDKLGKTISSVIDDDDLSLDEKIAYLKAHGIDMTISEVKEQKRYNDNFRKDREQIFEFKDRETGVTFNSYCFNGKDRYKLKKFGSNEAAKQQQRKKHDNTPLDLDKVEMVIADRLERSKTFAKTEKLERQIQDSDAERCKELNYEAFKHFTESLLEVGIVVDMNKQKNLVYWKSLPKQVGKHFAYKSSMFKPELLGKNIAAHFDLTEEDLIKYQNESVMSQFPKNHHRYHILNIGDIDIKQKSLEEYYTLMMLKNANEKYYDYMLSENSLVMSIWSKKSQRPIVQLVDNQDGSFEIVSNSFYPEQAAKALLKHEMDAIRNAESGTVFKYGMDNPNAPLSEELKHLHVQIIFSKDKLIRDRLIVDTSNAPDLDEMIKAEMDKQLEMAEKNFEKNLSKAINSKSHSFTNSNALLHLLDNDSMPESEKERVRELLNKQIGTLLTNGVMNLKSSQIDLDKYISENRETINKASYDKSKRQTQSHTIKIK
ncbi:hypothetical protein PQE20_17720 [Vibrio harveyi]|uniref:hypothetical protein n=1 Tax=Vibrio harveyi TaxID=669 RepID=UPI00234E2AA6|nr:hypothetical protein [Vibrio harveyi]WCP83257.1 hypothetical protein PQE20_17720 [Vibrio harveyi]